MLVDDLNQFGMDLVNEIKNNILASGKVASGSLLNSIQYQVVQDNNEYSLQILSVDYLKYVDKGRMPGKFPPKDAISKWIDIKGISPNGISKESLTFLIQREIGLKGIKETNIIQKSIDKVLNVYKSKIAQSVGSSEVNNFIDTLKKSLLY